MLMMPKRPQTILRAMVLPMIMWTFQSATARTQAVLMQQEQWEVTVHRGILYQVPCPTMICGQAMIQAIAGIITQQGGAQMQTEIMMIVIMVKALVIRCQGFLETYLA